MIHKSAIVLFIREDNNLSRRCGAQHNGLVGHQGHTAGGDLVADLLDGLLRDQGVLELSGEIGEHLRQVNILDGVVDVEQGNVDIVAAQVAVK